jgi:hypothetical protein
MKNKILLLFCAVAIAVFGCQKANEKNIPTTENVNKATPDDVGTPAAPCLPSYFNLAQSPTGQALLYKVNGTPSVGPITVTPINGSLGNNIIGSATIAGGVLKMTGLSFDPASGVFWGVTGSGGNVPFRLIKFSITNPNVVTLINLTGGCGILEISDIERDPVFGNYYALINNGSPNNRVVKVAVPSGVVTCLPNPLGAGVNPRGLTFGCNGQLYVMHVTSPNGKILEVSTATGLIINSYSYPGAITPGNPLGSAPEMGLHFDCNCISQFITGSFSPSTGILHTDGLPTGLGGPLYGSLLGTLKPTLDFARP